MPRPHRLRLATIVLGCTIAGTLILTSAYSGAATKSPAVSRPTLASLQAEIAAQQSEVRARQVSVTQLRTTVTQLHGTLTAVQTTANQGITSYNTLSNSYHQLVSALDNEFDQLAICATTETQDINEGSYDSYLTYVSSIGPAGTCLGVDVPADPNSPVRLPSAACLGSAQPPPDLFCRTRVSL